jgi:hypothetical protein
LISALKKKLKKELKLVANTEDKIRVGILRKRSRIIQVTKIKIVYKRKTLYQSL